MESLSAQAPPRDRLSALSPRTPRKPVSVVEAATSPLARTPRSATPNLRRAISSTTLIEALRDLVRKQPEALEHLAPILSQPRRRAGRCFASLVVLCAIAVAALVVRGAVAQGSASRVLQIRQDAQASEPRLPPRPKPGAKIAVAIALSACGALAGLCQWHPLARMQLQRLGAALLEAAGSAGAASGAQPQHVGRLARPFGHALRIGRALLPSSAVEWLLVAFNLVLFTRLYIFTRSGAFVAVRAGPEHAL